MGVSDKIGFEGETMHTEPLVCETACSATTTRPTILEQLLEEVRRESQVESERYLEETKVPYGGE